MAIPGERFVLDLSDDEDSQPGDRPRAGPLPNLIGEIKERTPKAATPPTPKTSTGFPTAKDRRGRSAFKQRRAAASNTAAPHPASNARPTTVSPTHPPYESSSVDEEKRIIDEENRQRLAAMSDAEIEKERAELLSNLSPSLVERLLRRANIPSPGEPHDEPHDEPLTSGEEVPTTQSSDKTGTAEPKSENRTSAKTVSFSIPESGKGQPTGVSHPNEASSSDDNKPSLETAEFTDFEDRAPATPPPDLRPASEFPTGPIHFPPPPRQDPVPILDPSSPSFYADLQAHYFPDTPHDPSSLSWLKPSDTDEHATASPYHPSSSATTIVPSALRFSLRGEILPPSKSLSLPTSLGLHHHADDPEAAGYTIPELSLLSRSTVPAQRCIAWQVLGRILFRLGKGEFGDADQELANGLWTVVEREAVVPRMMEEAEGGESRENKPGPTETGPVSNIGKHASAKAWAVEGIWLWQMGGGKRGIPKESGTEM